MGAITSFKATKASEFTAEFDAAVPETADLAITKGTDKIDGKWAWNEGRTIATFTATGNLVFGDYTLTVTNGTATVTSQATVKKEEVTEIKILNKVALTNGKSKVSGEKDNTQAYVYYDVLNQYGESLKDSTTITWSVSSCSEDASIDKAKGKLTLKQKDGFNYGTSIYITGVYSKTGISVTESVTVGMPQAVDSVEFAGFINKNDKTEIKDKLPNDFPKDTYLLLYKTKDQNGNIMDAEPCLNKKLVNGEAVESGNSYGESVLNFISDNSLVIDGTKFYDDEIVTIKGEEYSTVTIQPGTQVDKGGEVNITVISTKTGNKHTENFVIGSAGLLKSFSLSAPSVTVADGDENVEIPYVAKDLNDNTITNYETIVRSTNSLSLTATDGELTVYEKPDGTAGVKWSDDKKKYNPKDKETYKQSETYNDFSRNISLTTIVVGGESDNMILEVSDARRPNSIKSVKLNEDDNNMIISGRTSAFDMVSDNVVYLDQYNAVLDKDKAKAFFDYASEDKFDKYYYGVKVSTSETDKDKLGIERDKVYASDNGSIAFTAGKTGVASVKYSIVRSEEKDLLKISAWENASKVLNLSYTVVSIDDVTNFTITNPGKVHIETSQSEYENGSVGSVADNITGAAISINGEGDIKVPRNTSFGFKVTGTYKNSVLTVPENAYVIASESAITTSTAYWDERKNVTGVKEGILSWKDLYDINTAKNTRRDVSIPLEVEIKNTQEDTAKINVIFSDANSVVSTVKLGGYNTGLVENTNITKPVFVDAEYKLGWNPKSVYVADQYGQPMPNVDIIYSVSDVKQNEAEYAHIPNSFTVNKNNTTDLNITGAEIKDSFKLTATVTHGNIASASMDITVAGDVKANIKSGQGTKDTDDYKFRTEKLGYER